MSDTTPGGWPDASKPGVPMHPERDGVHWLQITSPEDSVMIAATWEAGLWSYPSVDQDYAPEELARLGDAVRYIGPCHTPAEVAALVAAARREGEAAAPVIEAARCIKHWHDREPDGMVVSAEHVRALWYALDQYDAAIRAAAKGENDE